MHEAPKLRTFSQKYKIHEICQGKFLRLQYMNMLTYNASHKFINVCKMTCNATQHRPSHFTSLLEWRSNLLFFFCTRSLKFFCDCGWSLAFSQVKLALFPAWPRKQMIHLNTIKIHLYTEAVSLHSSMRPQSNITSCSTKVQTHFHYLLWDAILLLEKRPSSSIIGWVWSSTNCSRITWVKKKKENKKKNSIQCI